MTVRTLLLTALLAAPAAAADWPQWMGPNRDNVWTQEGVLDAFPKDGPKIVWRAKINGGYAGPAVSGGKVFAADYISTTLTKEMLDSGNFDRKGSSGTERVLAYDAATGKELWKYEYPVKYAISYPAGPRCTPTVHGGKVYALGAEGHLACLNAADGKKVWAKELKDEYKTKSALWGYAAHPLIDGDKLITLAGGDGSHVIALNKDTGAELWKSQSQPEQGYAPPLLTTAGGARQLIVPGPTAVRGLDPETGKRLWTQEYDATSGSAIMTPVRSGEFVFFGGYKTKNILLELDAAKPEAKTVWRNKRGHGISPVNVQPFLVGSTLYGFDEGGKMMAVELPSGKRLWESNGPIPNDPQGSESAFLTKNGDRFFLFTETGELVIAKLSPEKYEEVGRAKILEQTNSAFGRKVVWCAPAYAGTRMYVRNDKELVCVELAK